MCCYFFVFYFVSYGFLFAYFILIYFLCTNVRMIACLFLVSEPIKYVLEIILRSFKHSLSLVCVFRSSFFSLYHQKTLQRNSKVGRFFVQPSHRHEKRICSPRFFFSFFPYSITIKVIIIMYFIPFFFCRQFLVLNYFTGNLSLLLSCAKSNAILYSLTYIRRYVLLLAKIKYFVLNLTSIDIIYE